MGDRGSAGDWVSAHVFHAGPLDGLLTGAVRPLVTELTDGGLVDGYFFLRYWEGGPHLRLRLRPSRWDARPPVRVALTARCGRYLAAHPSARPVPEPEYAAVAARIARHERRDTYTESLYPNDSVHFIGYRPEYDRYGTGESLAAVERHFVESSRIALALVTTTGRTARRTAAFGALLLARSVGPPRPEVTTGSEERYAVQRDRLLRLGSTLRHRTSAGSGSLAAWRRSLETLDRTLAGTDRHAAVIDTCAHLFCNRLGVALPEETHLRYLVARTGADLAGRE
jgi:thiopeptide-type bacteriocin biosynthesis protein